MKKRLLLYTFILLSIGSFAQTYNLQQLRDSALRNNIEIKSAQYNIEAAKQQRKETLTKFFPNIQAFGMVFRSDNGMAKLSIEPNQIIPIPIEMALMKKGTIAGITAVQPVFAGGQIVNGYKMAKAGEQVSELQMENSKNIVEKSVEEYYWKLVSLTDKLKTINAVEKLLSDIKKDVEVAIQAGLAMNNDLLQVQIRQNETESSKSMVLNGISTLKLTLAQYCGLSDTSFVVESYSNDIPVIAFKENHSDALYKTVEYKMMDKYVQVTKLEKRMALGSNLPSLAVGAGYNYHNLLEKDHKFGMVFATVSIPISGWWGGSHAIKRKKIEHQKAVENLESNSELLKIRMHKAWNDLNDSHKQLEIAQKSIEQAKENLRLNIDYYKAGITKMTDLLEAQLLYQQTRDKYTDSFAEYRIKLLEYEQSVGK